MLEQYQERAIEGKGVVLSLLMLRDNLGYAGIYVLQGYIQKTAFILCDKLQHEARKHYGPSEVVKRLQLLSTAILAPQTGLPNSLGPDV